jgi:hypothetical protein
VSGNAGGLNFVSGNCGGLGVLPMAAIPGSAMLSITPPCDAGNRGNSRYAHREIIRLRAGVSITRSG